MSEPSPSRDRAPRKELEPEVEEAVRAAAREMCGCNDKRADHPAREEAFRAFALKVQSVERERAAKIAEGYGPSRPIAPVERQPSQRILGRWEGEQAASENIAAAIRRGEGSDPDAR